MAMSNEYNIYTGGDNVGIDLASEVVTFAVEYGIIKKGGAWFSMGDNKWQGKTAVIRFMRDNPDIMEKVYGEILAKSV